MLLFTKLFFFCVGCVAYLLFLGLRLVTVSPGYFLCYWFSSPQLLPGVKLTVGSNSDPAVQALCAMGAQHVAKSVTVSCYLLAVHPFCSALAWCEVLHGQVLPHSLDTILTSSTDFS